MSAEKLDLLLDLENKVALIENSVDRLKRMLAESRRRESFGVLNLETRAIILKNLADTETLLEKRRVEIESLLNE